MGAARLEVVGGDAAGMTRSAGLFFDEHSAPLRLVSEAGAWRRDPSPPD